MIFGLTCERARRVRLRLRRLSAARPRACGRIARTVTGTTLVAACMLLIPGCSSGPRPISGSGTIELDEVDVASMVGGRIERLLVNEGASVRAGDTLVVLAQGEIAGEVESRAAEHERAEALWRDQQRGPRPAERKAAQADLDAASSALRLAETEWTRMRGLRQKELVSQADEDRALAARDDAAAKKAAAAERLALLEQGFRREQVAAARAATRAAQGALRSSRARAEELVLTAPIDGVVLLRNAVLGEVIAAGVPILTLGDPNKLWMRCYLAAPLVARVRLGSPARIRVLGVNHEFPGRVVEIATSSEFTPRAALTEEERANIVFGVKIALEPSGGILKPGLPADARFEPASP